LFLRSFLLLLGLLLTEIVKLVREQALKEPEMEEAMAVVLVITWAVLVVIRAMVGMV
jgi:hypothetical protein